MSQPNFRNNAEAQFALAGIEKYINDSVVLAFPMIDWVGIVQYDRNNAGNIVAVLECTGNIYYNAIFSKGDPNPILQRFVDEEPELDVAQFSQPTQSIESEYPAILAIVNSQYTDELDWIDNAKLDPDGSIVCIGTDGYKQLAIKITDTDIKLRLLNPDAEFAAPKKSNGALNKKTCKTGLSCGGTCISKTKICARALNIDQQKQFKELKKRIKGGDADAAKGIDDLKNEQQGSKSQSSPKAEAKVEAKPTSEARKMTPSAKNRITAKEAIAAIEATEARNMEKKTVANTLSKLDMSDPTNQAYARAAIEAFGFAKKNADGLVVDTDNGGTTSSFDRTSELMRARNRKTLSDDDALDAGSSLRQGLRAGKGSAVTEVNQRLAKEIMGRLSDSQKKVFAAELKDRDDLVEDAELLALLKKHQRSRSSISDSD